MKVFCIVNRKGGVGKTATARTLGAGLIRRGFRVLFVDLDSQGNLTFELGADPGPPGSMEILTGSSQAAAAIQSMPGGQIIPAGDNLAAADSTLTDTGKEYRLREALAPLAGRYDYIIIDTPAALGALTVNALTAADAAIIPAQADIFSLQGLAQLAEVITAVKKYCNPDLTIAGLLLTRHNGRAVLSRDMAAALEDAARQLQTRLFNTKIREGVAIREAQARRLDIFTYAPRSNAAADYSAFIDELLSI